MAMRWGQEPGQALTAQPSCGGPGQGPLETVVCHFSEGMPWTAIGLALMVLAVVGGVVAWRRAQERRARLPLLVFPTTAPPLTREGRDQAVRRRPPTVPPAEATGTSAGAAATVSDRSPAKPSKKGKRKRKDRPSAGTARGTTGGSTVTAAESGPAPTPSTDLPVPAAEPPPELLAEGTLQLLPGWLERVAGEAPSNEIRFVRVPGAAPEVTFGRQPGPEFRHVQLRSLAVSRLQARLVLEEAGWLIRNESGTNPTRVNGTALDSASGDVRLQEGDRIEMGDVTFIFHGGQGQDTLAARSGWHSVQGPRPTNQDAAVVRRLGDTREVAAVCDGMGSHVAGGRASHAALEALVSTLEEGVSLEEAVASAQAAVRDVALEEVEPDGVGTTLVAVLREGASYRVVNVGDSRAYRFRGGALERLTRDHSFVEEAVRSGRMTEEEARRSPLRNAVTRSLGESPAAEAEYFGPFAVERGTLLLLSSDGFHGVLDDEVIADLLAQDLPIPDRPRRLVRAALEAGTRDNVSVVVLAFG